MFASHAVQKHTQDQTPSRAKQTSQGQMQGLGQSENVLESSPPLHRYLGNSYVQAMTATGGETLPGPAAPPIVYSVPLRPSQSGILQRKCACGVVAGMSGECEECSKKQRLGLQTKLKVSEPGDFYEREADRIADQVTAMPAHHAVSGAPPRIQRFSGQSNGKMDAAPASVDHALASPGRPLEPALRQDMEQRFGYDFSRVRVHSGATAEQSAQEVNANAYTMGHEVVFGAGQFAPGTHQGRRLIAHELTHVVQQQNTTNSAVSVNHMESEPVLQRKVPQPDLSKLSCAYLINAREVNEAEGVRNRNKEGVAAHNAIGEDFASQVGDSAVRVEIEGAASADERTEKCGDAAPSTINPVKFNPHNGRSGLGLPDLVYWDTAGDQSFELAEIKFATWGCLSDAIAQVNKYWEKGSLVDDRKVYGFEKMGKRGKKLKRPKREQLGGDFSFKLMPVSRFNPNPVNVNGKRLSVSWCGPGVIVYKAITKRDEEEQEEKRKRAAAEAAKEAAKPQATIEFARTLNWLQSGLQPQLTNFIGRAPSGPEYVIIAPPFFYDEFVTKAITWETQKMYGLSMQPRYNPVHGFRNLGWTLVVGYAGIILVVAVAALLAPSAAGTAAASAAAGTEGASITSLAAWKAAKILVSTPGVKEAAVAAGVILAVVGNVKEASAATGKEPKVEVSNVDGIYAVPINAVKSEGKIMIGREVKYGDKTYRIIGTITAK